MVKSVQKVERKVEKRKIQKVEKRRIQKVEKRKIQKVEKRKNDDKFDSMWSKKSLKLMNIQ